MTEFDAPTLAALAEALAGTQAGICLCDEHDTIRFVNDAFRAAFFPDLGDEPTHFVEAIAKAIEAGRGIRLESMSLDAFVARVTERRRNGPERFTFAVDLSDGRWWWVNDYRLPTGWLLVVATEISALKNEELRLKDAHASALVAARTDALTGVANRRHGLEEAEHMLDEFRANRLPLSVAIIDIDHFKQINDAHGHAAGDEVLLDFVQRMSEALRARESLSRLGGEEFMVVMPETTPSRAKDRFERMIGDLAPLRLAGCREGIAYSVSVGLAPAHHSESLAALLARADKALYAAKAKGRGRVEIGRRGEDSEDV